MARDTMAAAVLHGREDLRLEQVKRPRAAAGELVLRVGAALTCGTDLKVYRRGYHARMGTLPMLFGHEVAGTVVEVGAGVTSFQEGDRVVALNSAPCDECFFCLRGQQNLCEDLLFNNGAYAEYLRVPARIAAKNTLHLPGAASFAQAALTEPLACAVRALEESGAQSGNFLVVIGAGPLGLMLMEAASLSGIEVLAVVKRDDQVRTAKDAGATHVVQIQQGIDTVAAVRELTPAGRGADVVIEAVAQPATWQWAVEMVRKGGVVNFFGGPASGTVVALDTNRLHYGDITLKASFHHTPSTVRQAFRLITEGGFGSGLYLTSQRSLQDVPEVFRSMSANSAAHGVRDIKTVILPEGQSL